MNYNKTKKNVFLDLELEYLDGLVGSDAGHVMKSVVGMSFHALGLHSEYSTLIYLTGTPRISQTGAATTTSRTMQVTEDATIVWARGHIHSGGTEVILTVNGKDICTSRPTYNNAGVITEMGICPKPIPLKKGDTVALRGTYDLTKHGL